MSIQPLQSIFARKIAILKLVAFEIGYEVTEGDYYRDPRVSYGHYKSLHRSRLAADLNLFKDGEYLSDGSGHDELHEIWVKMGGNPGIKDDLNHYSLPYNGMK